MDDENDRIIIVKKGAEGISNASMMLL